MLDSSNFVRLFHHQTFALYGTQLLGQLLAINTVLNKYEHTQKSLEHSGKAEQEAIAPQNGWRLYPVVFKHYSIRVLIYVYIVNVVSKVAY